MSKYTVTITFSTDRALTADELHGIAGCMLVQAETVEDMGVSLVDSSVDQAKEVSDDHA